MLSTRDLNKFLIKPSLGFESARRKSRIETWSISSQTPGAQEEGCASDAHAKFELS